ncbi:hypothetical protein HDK77DRAFT_252917 [Phyllosticta capitalensis]|uniref:Uncharacterized protein n=1 Tax=Phyllosticta capitalensis TaxID=121624 RepID=A0ABR1YLR5_9PEZI
MNHLRQKKTATPRAYAPHLPPTTSSQRRHELAASPNILILPLVSSLLTRLLFIDALALRPYGQLLRQLRDARLQRLVVLGQILQLGVARVVALGVLPEFLLEHPDGHSKFPESVVRLFALVPYLPLFLAGVTGVAKITKVSDKKAECEAFVLVVVVQRVVPHFQPFDLMFMLLDGFLEDVALCLGFPGETDEGNVFVRGFSSRFVEIRSQLFDFLFLGFDGSFVVGFVVIIIVIHVAIHEVINFFARHAFVELIAVTASAAVVSVVEIAMNGAKRDKRDPPAR